MKQKDLLLMCILKLRPNNHIHLTVKSVTFFAVQKNRPFLRQVMWALGFRAVFRSSSVKLWVDL